MKHRDGQLQLHRQQQNGSEVGSLIALGRPPFHEPERQEHLWKITHEALQGFRDMGCEIGHTETPIIPLFIRDNNKTFTITHDLLANGVFVTPVIAPAVPSDETLIRFALMATHTHEQIDIGVEKIYKAFKKQEVL